MHYAPLGLLLWALALRGSRDALLPELAGSAAYRVAPGLDLGLDLTGSLAAVVFRLRVQTCNLREMATWPDFDRERAMRLLNALYLQAGLIVSRTHPAATNDGWYSGTERRPGRRFSASPALPAVPVRPAVLRRCGRGAAQRMPRGPAPWLKTASPSASLALMVLLLGFQRSDARRQFIAFTLLLVAELARGLRAGAAAGSAGGRRRMAGAVHNLRAPACARWACQSSMPPSYSRHSPSPSKAMVLVTTLSRKRRSWLTRNTVPS